MKHYKTKLNDCLIIQPDIYEDDRGFFYESFNAQKYLEECGIKFEFVQDNHSRSKKNVLRGLHFQENNPQGKLVRVTSGKVFDVALDLRKHSSTYGMWDAVLLDDINKKQFWIPPGFAHGFYVISDYVDFEYKCTSYYDPKSEKTIIWNDPNLKINWPCSNPTLSEKDALGIKLSEY